MTRGENRRIIVRDLICDNCGYPVDSCICSPIEHQERRQHSRNKKEKRLPVK